MIELLKIFIMALNWFHRNHKIKNNSSIKIFSQQFLQKIKK